MSQKKHYFFSDIHLGFLGHDVEKAKERKLVGFLESIRADAEKVYIVGDLFDCWIEYRRAVPKGFYRTLSKLNELVEQGIEVKFFSGNHDFWLNTYLRDDVGLTLYYDFLETDIDGKKFYITHGDGLSKGDTGYKIIKKILRSRVNQFLYSLIHPDIGLWLAQGSSMKSRLHTDDRQRIKETYPETKDLGSHGASGMREFAQNKIGVGIDYVVMGHIHKPQQIELESGGRKGFYITLGDWINNFTFGEYSAGNFELKKIHREYTNLMFDGKKKSDPKVTEREEYFNNRDYRRKMMTKKKKSSKRKLSVFALFVIIIGALSIAYGAFLFNGLPPLSSLENPKTDLATKIYSEDGELIDQLFIENRTIVSLDAIPKDLTNALIATEDRKFYKHWGIDVDRIAKAFLKNLMSFSIKEGASTITQQLARNLYRTEIGQAISLTRKLREAITAVQIEKTYTKDEILLLYLNQVYFGRGAYGVEAAAKTFFDKSVTDLTLDECAMLVGMVKNPSGYYDPIEHPENCMDRRNTVLNNMQEEGYITKEVYELAKNDPIKAQPRSLQKQSLGLGGQFSEYVRQVLEKKSEKYGFNIYRDGLIVTTSINSRMQKHAVDAVNNQLKEFQKSFNSTWNWKGNRNLLNDAVDKHIKQSDEYKKAKTDADRQKIYNKLKQDNAFVEKVKEREIAVQVGFVCIDPKTGEIKAMVGQNPNFPFKYGLNHVTQIKRQPGSSFKPFVYTTAIENGYSPAYTVSNDPLRVVIGGQTWSPKGGGTGGMVSLREGITHSINVVAVRTAMELAPMDQVIKLAHKMGINSELPNVLSLALGVGEVSPLEMTSAFGVYPNEGIWVEPHAILRIEDRYGNIIEEVIPETREVISEGVAYIMSDMMEDVVNDGTATSIRNFFNRPAAGKTGTTQDYTDAWFVGFTPQLVAGCWLGFDDPRIKFGGGYGQGGRAAAPIWGRFMKYVYDDPQTTMELRYFEMPPDVEEANICTVTGLLANETCPAYNDLILKRNTGRRCSMTHAYTPTEGTETTGEPPPGSIGF